MSSEAPRRARARSAISSAGRAARRISAGALSSRSTCWRFSTCSANHARNPRGKSSSKEKRLLALPIERVALDVASVFDSRLRTGVEISPLSQSRIASVFPAIRGFGVTRRCEKIYRHHEYAIKFSVWSVGMRFNISSISTLGKGKRNCLNFTDSYAESIYRK